MDDQTTSRSTYRLNMATGILLILGGPGLTILMATIFDRITAHHPGGMASVIGILINLALVVGTLFGLVYGALLVRNARVQHKRDLMLEHTDRVMLFKTEGFPERVFTTLENQGYKRIDRKINQNDKTFTMTILFTVNDNMIKTIFTAFIFIPEVSWYDDLGQLKSKAIDLINDTYVPRTNSDYNIVTCYYGEVLQSDMVTMTLETYIDRPGEQVMICVGLETSSGRITFLDAIRSSSKSYKALTALIKKTFL